MDESYAVIDNTGRNVRCVSSKNSVILQSVMFIPVALVMLAQQIEGFTGSRFCVFIRTSTIRVLTSKGFHACYTSYDPFLAYSPSSCAELF